MSSRSQKGGSFRKGTKRRRDESEEVKDEAPKPKIDHHTIKNKIKRAQVFAQQKSEKKRASKEAREQRRKEAEELGEAAPKPVQKTQDNTREFDETVVQPDDDEVKGDEAIDEFSKYFNGETKPKIIITTNYKPTKIMYEFIKELLMVFPNSFYYSRKNYELKKIVEYSSERGFTDLIVLNEDKKQLNALTHVHLPEGPTAYYKLSSVVLGRDIPGRGRISSHRPEVILNNFSTRLGHRVGRMLGSLFHQEPNFKGRRVATFHNQRDFIFFRQHRYIFDGVNKARLQELGPRFTLKLQWLQHGTFDTKHGEYEWMHKAEMDTSRKRFFL